MIRHLHIALALTLLAAGHAVADDNEYMPPVTHAVTQAECSACHLAYPPGFLPARSWTAIMSTLDDHFGENAQLDEPTRADIAAYLVANAADASGRRTMTPRNAAAGAVPLRITELPWFTREHRGEVSRQMRQRAKSMANCAACHHGAERGIFEDD